MLRPRYVPVTNDLPVVLDHPKVPRWYGRTLIDRHVPGDRDKARELLTEAAAMYRDIGMPKHCEIAAALLRQLWSHAPTHPAARQPPNPALGAMVRSRKSYVTCARLRP